MTNILTYGVNFADKMQKDNEFGKWLDSIIDESGLKKKAIAKKAEIHPGSLSRIIAGEAGITKETASSLINAINELAGREIADLETGVRLAVGLKADPDKALVKPVLEAIGKAGHLSENDSILIANFIEMLDKQRAEEKDK